MASTGLVVGDPKR